MKIKWNGHASFTITSDNGTVIVTDPYNSDSYDEELTYDIVRDRADGALVSHNHFDHCYIEGLTGSPKVLNGSGEIQGIAVIVIDTWHDEACGTKRGKNIVFRLTVDGINICFLGDLGHILSQKQITAVTPVDIMLIPVGGTYTLDAYMAAELIDLIRPKVSIPMHFRTEKCKLPIKGVDVFLARMKNVKRLVHSEIDVSIGSLPENDTEVWVLDYAC